jgi:hypothetical protein
MLPKWHVLIGFLFSYILVYFFNIAIFSGLIIFISSFLIIDLDHFLLYIIKRKNLNFFYFYLSSIKKNNSFRALPKKEKNKYMRSIFIFHGVECWIIVFLLSLKFKFFIWVLTGFAVHIIFDWIELLYTGNPLYIKLSAVYTAVKNRGKEKFN